MEGTGPRSHSWLCSTGEKLRGSSHITMVVRGGVEFGKGRVEVLGWLLRRPSCTLSMRLRRRHCTPRPCADRVPLLVCAANRACAFAQPRALRVCEQKPLYLDTVGHLSPVLTPFLCVHPSPVLLPYSLLLPRIAGRCVCVSRSRCTLHCWASWSALVTASWQERCGALRQRSSTPAARCVLVTGRAGVCRCWGSEPRNKKPEA
jgi:hypothetical protein